ncbi:MAG: tRNA (N6-isopentenyl adenosine(37)-C2)-methylthiotransferase MiaB [Desulfobacterales bacterium]
MKVKRLYIHTIGCQMNVYDSEKMVSVLAPLNYRKTADLHAADLIIVNTCAIRQKAEQKVFSFLGRLSRLKDERPELLIGVGGCVAQQQGKKILARVPFVDFVFGTQAISRLPRIVRNGETHAGRVVDVAPAGAGDLFDVPVDVPVDAPLDGPPQLTKTGQVTRFVTIMQGCDNYCTYCVVPYVRGREASRRPGDIIAEIERLVAAGVREVTLLGQNVNSYGVKEGLCSFAELLGRIDAIDGLLRIRFTTSHPKDLSTDLCRTFGELPKLCGHIHLPVQSGSNPVLKRMNRRYTRENYLEKVAELREYCPHIAISSDFIVGFPGEEAADFDRSLDLIRTVGFDSLFAFKYSDRPQAPAGRFAGKVSEPESTARLQILLEEQNRITLAKHRSLLGSVPEVLVEGVNGRSALSGGEDGGPAGGGPQWTGRTSSNKIVNFERAMLRAPLCENFKGRLVRVRVEKAFAHSLWGVLTNDAVAPAAVKGEKSYAA